jgi:hypothetical protein
MMQNTFGVPTIGVSVKGSDSSDGITRAMISVEITGSDGFAHSTE